MSDSIIAAPSASPERTPHGDGRKVSERSRCALRNSEERKSAVESVMSLKSFEERRARERHSSQDQQKHVIGDEQPNSAAGNARRLSHASSSTVLRSSGTVGDTSSSSGPKHLHQRSDSGPMSYDSYQACSRFNNLGPCIERERESHRSSASKPFGQMRQQRRSSSALSWAESTTAPSTLTARRLPSNVPSHFTFSTAHQEQSALGASLQPEVPAAAAVGSSSVEKAAQLTSMLYPSAATAAAAGHKNSRMPFSGRGEDGVEVGAGEYEDATEAEEDESQRLSHLRAERAALRSAHECEQIDRSMRRGVAAAVLVCVFAGALTGWHTAIICGLSGPLVVQYFPTSTPKFQATMAGVLTASILIGACLGSLLVLPISAQIGRRWAFVLSGCVCTLASLGLGFINNFLGIVLVRGILGIPAGATAVLAPLYNAECTTKEKRGSVGSVYQISLVLGILLAEIANYAFNPHNSGELPNWNWHTQLAMGGIWGILLAVLGILIPESCEWLRQRDEARERSRWRAAQEVPPTEEYESEETARAAMSSHSPFADHELSPSGWGGLFHWLHFRWLCLAALLALSNQFCGINAVIYYAPRIFADAGYESYALVLTIAAVGSWNLISVLIALPLVRIFSRRTLMIAAFSIMSIAMLLVTIAWAVTPERRAIPAIISVVLFLFGFEIGPGPLFFILASEVFPREILHAGVSFTNNLMWAGNIGVTFLFPVLDVTVGAAATFGIFAAVCVISLIGYYCLLPENAEQNEISGAAQRQNSMEAAGERKREEPARDLEKGGAARREAWPQKVQRVELEEQRKRPQSDAWKPQPAPSSQIGSTPAASDSQVRLFANNIDPLAPVLVPPLPAEHVHCNLSPPEEVELFAICDIEQQRQRIQRASAPVNEEVLA